MLKHRERHCVAGACECGVAFGMTLGGKLIGTPPISFNTIRLFLLFKMPGTRTVVSFWYFIQNILQKHKHYGYEYFHHFLLLRKNA